MIRAGDHARVMEVRRFRTLHGEARLFLHVDLDASGGVARIGWSLPPPGQVTDADRAAARMLDKLAGSLRGGHSVRALIQRTEQFLDMLEALRAIEDAHGERARQLLAGAAA